MGKIYGYARVSSKDQNEDRQIIALHEMGVNDSEIYIDKQSGKDFNRPKYKKLIRKLKKDDLIYIKSIDRLGRNYEDIIEQWKIITKDKQADIVVLDMPILDTRRGKDLMGTFLADIVLAVLSYVAENERTNIRQRQAEGIAAAKARGIRFGPAPMPLPDNFHDVYQDWKHKKISVEEAAKLCNMGRSTFYNKARLYEKATSKNT
ncbi:Site-specific DNA recombinase [Lachnospiraceae bacterium]|nr:Site-specific DNA recombinase [Lachnospiraceae bacterium]